MTYTCTVCPVSCRVTVQELPDGRLDIEGYSCARGLEFVKNEHVSPKRILTTTVRLNSGSLRRLPVISRGEIPRSELVPALRELRGVIMTAPVCLGDVVVPDIRGTGVDVVAARSVN